MTLLTSDIVRTALSDVIDHDSGMDVLRLGMISGITIQEGLNGAKVGFLITVQAHEAERKAHLREVCERAVKALSGVESVTAVLTAEAPPESEPRRPAAWNETPAENVRRVIAVASGKGGVGKSTVAVGLAEALAASGKNVGLLDADIYGPSIPRMLGLSGKPELDGGKMIPRVAYGVACMSIGFITGDEAAIFRGPMISKTLSQLLRGTRWGALNEPLDVLLVDMPPGTGDIHLSLAQNVPLDGAIIVTTPQEVALLDARKSLMMFLKLGVKVLGVVENMAGEIFGQGGGQRLAEEFNVPFLGSIPLNAALREAADAGERIISPELEKIAKLL